eukprot:TRINITY_DN1378_c0_g1_i10.p1 TRINITY_DN1378_c0_g1~~TRINITY_DN1378_c0_g1_i10.p1  ORF type:complete len:222 (-),score=34.22 TRINITY_DN1378_c0_g1_i10:116-781(-)
MAGVPVEHWYYDIPPITRAYMTGALLTTAACAFDLISPFSLYFSWDLMISKGQVWRLITNFFFFGANFSLDFIFHMFFLVRYSRSLEEGSFRGRTADFFWMLFLGAVVMSLLAPVLKLNFLGPSLTFMMVYVWGRRNPYARMNLLGVFNFTAPYLPWVLLSFSFMLGSSGVVDVLGIMVGHLYYYLEDVYPLMIPSHFRFLKTPRFVKILFNADAQIHVQE